MNHFWTFIVFIYYYHIPVTLPFSWYQYDKCFDNLRQLPVGGELFIVFLYIQILYKNIIFIYFFVICKKTTTLLFIVLLSPA